MAEHDNCLATIFNIDYRYPASIKVLENFINSKISSILSNNIKTFLMSDRDIEERVESIKDMFPYKIARPIEEIQKNQL